MKKTRLPLHGISGLDATLDSNSRKRAISLKRFWQVLGRLFFDGLVDAMLCLGTLFWIALGSVNPRLWDWEEEHRIDFLSDFFVASDAIDEGEEKIVMEVNPNLIDDYPATLTSNE